MNKNFLVFYFYGLFFGNEGILGFLLASILFSSYPIYAAYMNGVALSNSKNFADSNSI